MKQPMVDDVSALSSLGSNTTEYPFTGPHRDQLEVFSNQYPDRPYKVVYSTDEFTSLCPKTNQPDFGSIRIEYVPDYWCVETKSLKLYLFAYRNEGSFMETITNKILTDFVGMCAPRECVVVGRFAARGGVVVEVTASHKAPSSNNV